MSNSKWEKLIDNITELQGEVFVNYKLIYSSEVYSSSFISSDYKPFFIEPTVYREVEWIEFPSVYEDYINRNNRKAGKKLYQQNIDAILQVLNSIGQFEIEFSKIGLKIYAYR